MVVRFLEPADVVAAAAELAGGRVEQLGAVDLAAVGAALLQVRAAAPEDPAEAAALVFSELTRAAPFLSANRAVAWLAACQLLSLNGGVLAGAAAGDLGALLGEVASGGEVGPLTEWIRARCAPAGRRERKGEVLFERFSDGAREVLDRAAQEARDLGHDFLGTEHLLLGLVETEGGRAAAALARAGVTAQGVREMVRSVIGASEGAGGKPPRFTPRTKKVLELSLREAMRGKSHRIGTEHILLAVIREGSGVASKVMEDLGVDIDRLRRDLVEGVDDVDRLRRELVEGVDALTGRIQRLETECDRLRQILRRHGIEPDSGERSA